MHDQLPMSSVPKAQSHLRALVAEKSRREGRRLSVRLIAVESGASRSAVELLLRNAISRVPLGDLALLCRWLQCQPGDILKLTTPPDDTAVRA